VNNIKHLSLYERMKIYEKAYDIKLPIRLPIIIRIDGKKFKNMSKKWKLEKPYDYVFIDTMNETGKYLCKNIQNCIFAFLQSDEISLLLLQKRIESESFLSNRIQRLSSIIASMSTMYFNQYYRNIRKTFEQEFYLKHCAIFDCRVFILPKEEVVNYFINRQVDWSRNSLQMYARHFFSHKELNNKNSSDMHEMLYEKEVNWNNLSTKLKNGRCIIKEDGKWITDNKIPIFTQDRNYIDKFFEEEV